MEETMCKEKGGPNSLGEETMDNTEGTGKGHDIRESTDLHLSAIQSRTKWHKWNKHIEHGNATTTATLQRVGTGLLVKSFSLNYSFHQRRVPQKWWVDQSSRFYY